MVIFTVDLYLHLVKFVSVLFQSKKITWELSRLICILRCAPSCNTWRKRTACFNFLFNKDLRLYIYSRQQLRCWISLANQGGHRRYKEYQSELEVGDERKLLGLYCAAIKDVKDLSNVWSGKHKWPSRVICPHVCCCFFFSLSIVLLWHIKLASCQNLHTFGRIVFRKQ